MKVIAITLASHEWSGERLQQEGTCCRSVCEISRVRVGTRDTRHEQGSRGQQSQQSVSVSEKGGRSSGRGLSHGLTRDDGRCMCSCVRECASEGVRERALRASLRRQEAASLSLSISLPVLLLSSSSGTRHLFPHTLPPPILTRVPRLPPLIASHLLSITLCMCVYIRSSGGLKDLW